MTGQSVLDEGLASYAHECFERANSLHWAIEREATQPPVYLDKQFRDMHFVTNGYDYWFAKGNGVNVVDCGMVAVLDYFNCKIESQPFRSLCGTATALKRFGNMEDIWASLWSGKEGKAEALRRLKETDVESLIKKGPEEDEDEDEDEDDGGWCPRHPWSSFLTSNPWKNSDVQSIYGTCCNYTRRKLFGVPLLVLNKEIVINESNIKIIGDKMFFLQESNGKPLPPINFAACWNCGNCGETPPDFIDVDQDISAPQLLIPPIMLHEFDQGYHLVLDFFRNDWMVKVDDEHTIPVPIITNEIPQGEATFVSTLPDYFFDFGEPFKIFEDEDDSDE
jgi:hypothetical protein